MKRKYLTTLLFIFLSQNIVSYDLKIAEFSTKCSALFLLMTMPQNEQWKPFVDNMSNLSETINLVAGISYEMSGVDLNTGQLIDRRNVEADKLILAYKKNPEDVINFYARCDKFREDFAYAAIQSPEDDSKIINSLSIPGNIKMTEQKTGLIEMVLDVSFQEMNAAGIDSIVEIYEKIR